MSLQAAPNRLPVVILISGSGTNLQAIIDACADGALAISIRAVISNNPAAAGIDRARRAGIATQIVDHRAFPNRHSFEAALARAIDGHEPVLVVLAGFMRVLGQAFVRHYRGRLINIHPSLLPAFPGLNTHQRVLESGISVHGVSVHFVTEEVDSGPIIMQAHISVLPDDSPERLAARLLKQEHRIYPCVIGLFAQGRLQLQGDRVVFDGRALETPLNLADFEGNINGTTHVDR